MKLSIITINYNNAPGLEQTMQSVFAQTFKDFEYIIIDGGSKDGSKELIIENKNNLKYWVSEPDNGIYHAQNKGIKESKGTYLLLLNSGDTLINSEILLETLSSNFQEDIVYGDVFYKKIFEIILRKYDKALTFSYMYYDGLPHQGCFIRKSLFDKLGLYDESLKISADWKFFMQALFFYHASTRYLNYAISTYDATGTSSDPANSELMISERRAVLKELFPGFVEDYEELFLLRNQNRDLINSRYIKAALKLKELLPIGLMRKISKHKLL